MIILFLVLMSDYESIQSFIQNTFFGVITETAGLKLLRAVILIQSYNSDDHIFPTPLRYSFDAFNLFKKTVYVT